MQTHLFWVFGKVRMELISENIQAARIDGVSSARTKLRARIADLMPTTQVLYVGLLLIALQTADGILTGIGINRFGIGVEGNPILRAMMHEFGHVPALASMKLLAIFIVLFLTILTKRLPWVKGAMGAVSCIYVFAAIIPWAYILFVKPYI